MASAMGAATPGQQQAYQDTINAMAMTQAVAAAGQQFPAFLQGVQFQFPAVAVPQPAPAAATDATTEQAPPEQPVAEATEAQEG